MIRWELPTVLDAKTEPILSADAPQKVNQKSIKGPRP